MGREEQLVVVRVGEGHFGLNVQEITEIVIPKDITPIPQAPSFVEGLMNLRGQIVTVVHLGRKLAHILPGFRLNYVEQDQTTERIVIMNHAETLIGLHVEAVEQIFTINPEDIELPEDGGLKDQIVINGVAKVSDLLVIKLNPDLLFQPISGEGGELL